MPRRKPAAPEPEPKPRKRAVVIDGPDEQGDDEPGGDIDWGDGGPLGAR